MPVHDWTRVDAGLFHDFHQGWTISLRNALNAGILPSDYFALVEQNIRGPIPDVLTLKLAPKDENSESNGGGLAVASAPPRARVVRGKETSLYVDKANRITVRHRHGEVVAVIEIVSPGNKASRAEFRAIVEKSVALLRQRIHLLIVDVFPPTKRDPNGIHRAIWEELGEDDFESNDAKPLTFVSYDAGPPPVAYVGNLSVGDVLEDMPLFLNPEFYVLAPLEATYQETWSSFPVQLKRLLT